MMKIGNRRAYGKALLLTVCFTVATAGIPLKASEPGRRQQSARLQALGGAGTALAGDTWSMYYNPAQMRGGWSGGVNWSPAPFGLSELATTCGAASLGDETLAFGAGFRSSGFSLYRETEASVAASGAVDPRFHAGVAVSWRQYTIARYGQAGVALVDAGVAADVSDAVTLGASVSALNRPLIGGSTDRVPIEVSVGAAVGAGEDVLLLADAVKDERHPVRACFGVEYRLLEHLALRAGSSTEPSRFTAGIGIRHSGVALDYAMLTHSDLGMSHTLAVSVRLQQ